MPRVNGQGYSPATLAKQFALDTSLGYILGPIVAIAKREGMPCVIADMTAGMGVDAGRDGSPLIIAKHIRQLKAQHQYPIKTIFTERRKPAIDHLQHVMSQRYPDIQPLYVRDQAETIAATPTNAYGLFYFDPNGYNAKPGKPDGLDERMLARLGQSHRRIDILITRECQAGYRMQCAPHCPGTLTIQDYLARTGKKRQYLLPYADYHWWTFGFATNWTAHPLAKKHGWVDVQGPDGPATFAKWTKGMEDQAENIRARRTFVLPPTQGELPWGA